MSELKIPEDLKALWAQAQVNLEKPWHWEQITPKQLIEMIERIALLEQQLATHLKL